MTAPAWMDGQTFRPCTADPERWFSVVRREQKIAVAQCKRCPLLSPCREYALAEHPPYGIWGGLTERARRAGGSPSATPKRSSTVPVDCDSPTSYEQHRRRGEDCEPCLAKRTATIERSRRARLDAEHAWHGGSMVGYHTHKALGEEPCDACRDANRARCAARRARSRTRARPQTRTGGHPDAA
jgi:hypothetical protein